uniref:Thioredoxin domain-containing protein n=1 Tax=Panagrolaimus sp. JU765 TaxID=591449 RepID=A0AC34Q2K2_9BILA
MLSVHLSGGRVGNLMFNNLKFVRNAHFLASVPLKKKSGAVCVKNFENKPLMLYFSAGWCRSCKMFTPKVRDFYEKLKNEKLDVVWVSRDKTAEDQLEYYNKALPDWPYVPFGADDIQKLVSKYEVKTIPAVLVVNDSGEVIDDGARMKIERAEESSDKLVEGWKKLI